LDIGVIGVMGVFVCPLLKREVRCDADAVPQLYLGAVCLNHCFRWKWKWEGANLRWS